VTELLLLGETLQLLPEKAIYWEKEKTLLVADMHLGKTATFRAANIPVPPGTTTENLQRLSRILKKTGAQKLIILGDFFHARQGRADATLKVMEEWRASLSSLHITLVRGNHDLRSGDPCTDLGIICGDAPLYVGPFALHHHPVEDLKAYTLCGHIHPSVRLEGKGRQSLRLPCFYFGKQYGILPAFGSFTGTADISVKEGDRVFVVAEQEVIKV
jgi:DNA ligase-associated metallophosphoesterase